MSMVAVDPSIQRMASISNSFAADLLQLHRPVAGSFGNLVCAESCRVGNHGAGDAQVWPCATAQMAKAQIDGIHSALKQEAKLLEPVNAD